VAKLTVSVLAAAIALLAFSPSVDARVIGSGSGQSFASASGNAKRPKSLWVSITTGGVGHNIDVTWGVSCSGRRFRFNSRQGTFHAYTPNYQRLPIPLKRPGKCSVDVSASQSNFYVEPFIIDLSLIARP
jgi:hypothetical protein